MRFKTEKIDGGLRFTAPDGWVDLQFVDDGRAYVFLGTYNGTIPEVFGARLWRLLHDGSADLGLRVVAYDDAADPFIERVLIAAGFSKDGIRRGWHADGQDGVIYSILASELRFEIKEPVDDGNGQVGEAAEPLDAGNAGAPLS